MAIDSEPLNENEIPDDAFEPANGLCEKFEAYVAARPLKAIAVAFVVGLLFGRVVL